MYPDPTPLLAAARPLIGEFSLSHSGMSAGTVAAAVQTVSGQIYTGVSLDLACGIGFCAEHAAIAEMLKHRETHIDIILAVCDSGVLPPCGRCRELLLLVDRRNSGAWVVLPGNKVATLSNLLPNHWLDAEG